MEDAKGRVIWHLKLARVRKKLSQSELAERRFCCAPSPPIKLCGSARDDRRNYMAQKIDEVTMAALDLSIEERAQLAGKLLLSLDEPSESEVENLWLEEAERRLKEFHEGRIRGIPADDVFRRAMDDIS